MRYVHLVGLGLAASLPISFALGRNSGVIPGKSSIPRRAATAMPSCGNCHTQNPNSSIKLAFAAATSVKAGSTMPVNVKVSGANQSSTRGGFVAEATAGSFVPGSTTRVDFTTSGRPAVTHNSSLNRSWSFNWKAPTTTGLVSMFSVAVAADGNGKDKGDHWGFYGPNATVGGTPYRVFVNDSAIDAFGTACAGDKGFVPVIGIAKNAAVGGTFQTEVYNVPPAAACLGVFGLSNKTWGAIPLPLNLAILKAPGCFLRVSMDVLQPALTTGSGAGNGVAKHTWIIPNIAAFKGLKVHLQALTFDKNANAFGVTTTQGLTATIQ